MYKGWIIADEEEADVLVNFGIELGPYNEKGGCFENCLVSDEALHALDPHWYRFYWGLNPVVNKEVG